MTSFRLEGIKNGARVAVAMSGGVDSSVAATLMHKEGYEVIGITLQLYDHGQAVQKTKACCAGQDIYDARRVSEKIGFKHYVLDYESVFKESVIDDFADSYLRGETPIPCVRCNQKVKFLDLLKTSKDLDCDALVTGHYVQKLYPSAFKMSKPVFPDAVAVAPSERTDAQIRDPENFGADWIPVQACPRPRSGESLRIKDARASKPGKTVPVSLGIPPCAHSQLHKALDLSKDQSYFLFSTTQEDLDYLHFPLGGIPKSRTREYAQEFGLEIAEKPDSQDICFVPSGNYAEIVAKLRPESLKEGHIVDLKGNILGNHKGIIHFTIGQRRGIGVSAEYPLYVVALDPIKNQVVVGPKEALAKEKLLIKDVNWLFDFSKYPEGYPCTVKVRSTGFSLPATVQMIDSDMAVVILKTPEYGIAKGQACVFYDDSRVLGGGWICD